jgi:hypothetical protein
MKTIKLPTINFNFFPEPPASKVERKLEEQHSVQLVRRAINLWFYS